MSLDLIEKQIQESINTKQKLLEQSISEIEKAGNCVDWRGIIAFLDKAI
jgi:beta-lactamase class A